MLENAEGEEDTKFDLDGAVNCQVASGEQQTARLRMERFSALPLSKSHFKVGKPD
jgi:hypothetical protein